MKGFSASQIIKHEWPKAQGPRLKTAISNLTVLNR